MTTLEQAVAYAGLMRAPEPPDSRQIRTAQQMTEAIFADSAERKRQPFLHIEPETWCKKWLASTKFFRMRVPVACIALACSPRDINCAIERVNSNMDYNDQIGPITVDVNKPGVGRTKTGHVPPITVIDGKHRFAAAVMRGSTHIWAWVGELAAERIKMRPAIAVAARKVRNHMPATNLDRAMALNSAGTVEPLHHILARELGADPAHVRDMVAQFKRIASHGRFGAMKNRINAVSPPGWSSTVEKMKGHPEIDNPFALAWWMHDQGNRPKAKKEE